MFGAAQLLGAMGVDPDKFVKVAQAMRDDLDWAATEIEAHGKMLRALCKAQGVEVIPMQPRKKEIDHGDDTQG